MHKDFASRGLLLRLGGAAPRALTLSQHVPPECREQFLATNARCLFDERAVFRGKGPFQMEPVMNADRRHPKDPRQRGLAAGDVAGPR